ncbi:hypothetical protein PQR02_15360 [Paraburkholderia sediminicola]|uniref:Uncharacterized protein n=1 Tax=Paraburkholderia rhynchosiae TaxID=487049 RepID=A0ACC7NLB1_9BURK
MTKPADINLPKMTERLAMYGAALLFSDGIKETRAAIGNSTKRGQKKGLFALRAHAHDR